MKSVSIRRVQASHQSSTIPTIDSGDCPEICNRSGNPQYSHLHTTRREQGVPGRNVRGHLCSIHMKHMTVMSKDI